MKKEIEKSEYDRLKSREEKLMAYYERFVDKENDLATVEDIVNKNIELEEENKKLKSDLSECECSMHFENDEVGYRKRECKKLKEEIRFLEQCLDNKEKVNKKLREELSAYDREYFDEDKKAEHIFMEEDTLQELRDLGEI